MWVGDGFTSVYHNRRGPGNRGVAAPFTPPVRLFWASNAPLEFNDIIEQGNLVGHKDEGSDHSIKVIALTGCQHPFPAVLTRHPSPPCPVLGWRPIRRRRVGRG